MYRKHRLLLIIFSILAIVPNCPSADAQPTTIKRDIIALYDPARETEPRTTRLHRFLELTLNHLGYRVAYWTAGSGMPDQALVDRSAAIMSWFDAPVAAPAFAKWTERLVRTDGTRPKQIAFGQPGVALDASPADGREAYLARFGVKLTGPSPRWLGSFARIISVDPAMIGYDAALTLAPGLYPDLTAAEGAHSYLRVAPAENSGEALDLAVIGPDGAYVNDVAALIFDPRLSSPLWCLNIFTFFEAVLGKQVGPVPDVTTMLGRRLFFATVDPQGWLLRAPALRYGEPTVLASKLLGDVLLQFPEVPIGVAITTGDLDPKLAGRDAEAGRAAAAALFALPQVEIATVGRSYVSKWQFFADYDPRRELDRLTELGRQAEAPGAALLPLAFRTLEDAVLTERSSKSERIAGAPRKYASERFDLDSEIGGAIRATEALAPKGRRVSLFFWSGDARPFTAAAAATQVAALGGGGGSPDPGVPSIAALWPFSAAVGKTRQVYHALSPEPSVGKLSESATLTFHAFAKSLDATEMPRRLKPFELSFSAGSIIDFGRKSTIEALLGRARDGEVFPVRPSDYVDIVEGFESAEINEIAPLRWRIEHRGGTLATVRFDNAVELSLDLDASRGVLGARRKDDTLYVALDPVDDAPVVALASSSAPTATVSTLGRVAIESSRWAVSGLVHEACNASFSGVGFGPGDIVLADKPGRQVRVEMSTSAAPDRPVYWITLTADSLGRIKLALPPMNHERMNIAVSGSCGS
jgi:hypothetical protein